MTLPIDEADTKSMLATPASAFPPAFRRLLVNSLVAGVTSTFLWFALTSWVYLETRSVITIRFDEPEPVPAEADAAARVFDVRGAVDAIRAVSGLALLVFLAACNKLLGACSWR